ncbi:ABC transporter substrate-binding protein [Tessaracoccus caeni]|uniref:ABC transporter substrate-binding protein n=1 Tax=Tessaracoccus caeni TaxID=3031239 RepID=UPI0023D9B029|nr:extracellular solute-binding protein [Tessaracoccus caeni]MDF1490180.1 extracellular solute-binding protein [Tessaracoccus caeni]
MTRPATDPRGRPKRRRATVAVVAALALGATALSACSPGETDANVTTLNFFQFKGEALADFELIIDEFEDENPNIKVIQNQQPDADTSIRTLLVKRRTPDVITLNAGGKLPELLQAGVFYDFSKDPILDTINPAVQEIIADLGNREGEVNALGYINNANGIIYNRQIFKEQGLEVPETWDELIEVCEKLKAAGITPFYGTLGDSWTVLPSFNGMGAYAAQDGFFDQMREIGADVGPDSAVSFSKNFATVAEQQAKLYSYAQDGYRGRTYDDGNGAFARGEVAMYMQGVWAMNPIKQANPDIDAGIFPYPVTDNPDDRVLVTGVDVAVMIGRDTPHMEEAQKFVEFMFRPEIIERLAQSQNMIPSVEGAAWSDDPALQSVKPYFDAGRIAGFIDHQVPGSIPLDALVSRGLMENDPQATLQRLDSEWAKVSARTIK